MKVVLYMQSKFHYIKLVEDALAQYEDDFIFGGPLLELQERLQAIESSIAVVGQFSVGKSALLNALLGEELLSTRRIESTKVLTKIKTVTNEQDKAIVLHYKNGESKTISIEDIEELARYTTFQGTDETDELKLVELYWPISFLNEELTLIDTPGANSLTASAFKVTEEALRSASAIIYLFNGQKGMDQVDYKLLTELIERQKHIFIVATHVDGLTQSEWQEVESSVLTKIQQQMDKSQQMIYPVSSMQALQGKAEHNPSLLQASGITQLEDTLQTFMLSGAYEQASLRSIEHDYTTLMEEIAEEEASEEEKEALARKHRQLRYERLVAITALSYDKIERYGKDILRTRSDQLVNEELENNEALRAISKKYKAKIAKKFEDFKNVILNHPDVTSKFIVYYKVLEKELNATYQAWADNVAKLNEQKVQQIEQQIKAEDQMFIELMASLETDVAMDWRTFEDQIKRLSLKIERIAFETEELHEKVDEYDEYLGELDEAAKKSKKELAEIEHEAKKLERKFNLENDYYEQDVIALGKAPKVKQHEYTTGFIIKKRHISTDDSELVAWQEKMAALTEEHELKKQLLTQELEEQREFIFEQQEWIEVLEDKITDEKEALNDEVLSFALATVVEQNQIVDETVKAYTQELHTLWRKQSQLCNDLHEAHIKKLTKQFVRFVSEVKTQAIKNIEVA